MDLIASRTETHLKKNTSPTSTLITLQGFVVALGVAVKGHILSGLDDKAGRGGQDGLGQLPMLPAAATEHLIVLEISITKESELSLCK